MRAPILSAKVTGTWQGIFEYGPSIKYTVSAALAHYTFAKTSPFQAGTTGIKIIGTPDPFTATGKVTFGVNVDPSRVNLNITGATIAGFTIHPAKDGTWSQAGFESDQSYTVTPVLSGYTFSPSSLPITLTNNANLNFQGNQGK